MCNYNIFDGFSILRSSQPAQPETFSPNFYGCERGIKKWEKPIAYWEERPTPRHLTNNSIKKFEATTSNSPSCFAIPTRSFLNADRRDLLWWTCQKRVRIWLLQQLDGWLTWTYIYTLNYTTQSPFYRLNRGSIQWRTLAIVSRHKREAKQNRKITPVTTTTTSLIRLVGNCFTCWALWLWNFFSFHFVFPFVNCLRACVCLTWLYDNMMETTRSEIEKKLCPGSARGGGGFHVCVRVRVSLLEAEPAEIVGPGAPFEKWKRFCHFSFFLLFNCSPLTTIVPFSQCSAVVLSACVFSSLPTNLRILPTNRDGTIRKLMEIGQSCDPIQLNSTTR